MEEVTTSELLLSPGVSIKPQVSLTEVEQVLWKSYGFKCLKIKELNGYDDNNYHVFVTENTHGYILKIINSLDSKKFQFFEAQNALLLFLETRGICCPKPVKNLDGNYFQLTQFSNDQHIVRLLEFIPGSILYQVPADEKLFVEIGQYVAKLDETLKGFHHPAYDNYKSLWMLPAVPELKKFLFVIEDPEKKALISTIIAEFTEKVLPQSADLEKGMIHGDFNEQNILVENDGDQWRIKGILDFGDSQIACYLYELAITMTYMIIQAKRLDIGGFVLEGYNSVRKLPRTELSLLKVSSIGAHFNSK